MEMKMNLLSLNKKNFRREVNATSSLMTTMCILDTALKQHADRRNGRVIILGCGDRVELSNISSQYDRHYGRG